MFIFKIDYVKFYKLISLDTIFDDTLVWSHQTQNPEIIKKM